MSIPKSLRKKEVRDLNGILIWRPPAKPCGSWSTYFEYILYEILDCHPWKGADNMRSAGEKLWKDALCNHLKVEMLGECYLKAGDFSLARQDKPLAYSYFKKSLEINPGLKQRVLNRVHWLKFRSLKGLGKISAHRVENLEHEIKGPMTYRRNRFFLALERYILCRRDRYRHRKKRTA